MPVQIEDLCADLAAETAVLHALLVELDDDQWAMATPAAGWTVQDQVGHLAYFDEAVTTAVREPDRFRAERDAAGSDVAGFVDAITAANARRSPAEVLDWSRTARASMIESFLAADSAVRVPWYGPDMSVASALTARIMETWAHGQDVFDALGLAHPVTPALRQVAHIGVRALPNSFATRRRAVPEDPVRVELLTPSGERWTWGPDDAVNVVRGAPTDFCLVVTQRRHVADTGLTVTGAVADEWMSIAQAFAGPPGTGRRPGQFAEPGSAGGSFRG